MLLKKMCKKNGKENRLYWYETGTPEEKRYNLLVKIMIDYNPLFRVEVGRPQEVLQVQALAGKIVAPMNFSPEVSADCKYIISVMILFCLYQSLDAKTKDYASFGTGYCGDYITACPTIDFLLRYFSSNVKEEYYCDDEGIERPEISICSFFDLIQGMIGNNWWESDKFDVKVYLPNYKKHGYPVEDYIDSYSVNSTDILNRYREHNDGSVGLDIIEIHPWIYNAFLTFSMRKKRLLEERAYLCVLAIENYIEKHPMVCSYMVRELFERNIYRMVSEPKKFKDKFHGKFELDYNKIVFNNPFRGK